MSANPCRSEDRSELPRAFSFAPQIEQVEKSDRPRLFARLPPRGFDRAHVRPALTQSKSTQGFPPSGGSRSTISIHLNEPDDNATIYRTVDL